MSIVAFVSVIVLWQGLAKISGRLKGSFGSLSAENFSRNSFGLCREKQSHFGISAERAVSAERRCFCRKRLFLQKYASISAEIPINFGKISLQFLQKQLLSAETPSFGSNCPFLQKCRNGKNSFCRNRKTFGSLSAENFGRKINGLNVTGSHKDSAT